MYISFTNGAGDAVGGAVRDALPAQDLDGRFLDDASVHTGEVPSEGLMGNTRDGKMEERAGGSLEDSLDKMTEALERNTIKASELAAKIQVPGVAQQENGEEGTKKAVVLAQPSMSNGGYFDMDALSTHFGRLNELLTKSSQHVEALTQKHNENENNMRKTVESLTSRRESDGASFEKLSTHLDRIQSLMEESVKERRDSAKEVSERPAQIDFSPLTHRLEKVQQAVEANSALIKQLLDEGANDADTKQAAATMDLQPLTEHLERIHAALQEQGEHTKALLSFASGSGEGGGGVDGIAAAGERDLAPLGEHLEQIYNAIEEGTKHARESSQQQVNLSSLETYFENLQQQSEKSGEQMEQIRTAIEDGNTYAREAMQPQVDLTSLDKHFEGQQKQHERLANHMQQIHSAIEEGNARVRESVPPALDLSSLENHFAEARDLRSKDSEQMQRLLEAQHSTREAIKEASKQARKSASQQRLDLSPLEKHFEAIREHGERHGDLLQDLLKTQNATLTAVEEGNKHARESAPQDLDLSPLNIHFEALLQQGKDSAEVMQQLLSAQNSTREAVESNAGELDFSPLVEYLEAIRDSSHANTAATSRLNTLLQKHTEQSRGNDTQLAENLTTHLSTLQSVTEQNATHLKQQRENHTASATRMEKSVTATSEQMRSLVERNKLQESKVEAQHNQMRELMSGQREMVEVMRQLTKSIVAQNKSSCDHIVVPPPRKMGRKVVGFVYDAKDGPV